MDDPREDEPSKILNRHAANLRSLALTKRRCGHREHSAPDATFRSNRCRQSAPMTVLTESEYQKAKQTLLHGRCYTDAELCPQAERRARGLLARLRAAWRGM